jgi:hypothetical protein
LLIPDRCATAPITCAGRGANYYLIYDVERAIGSAGYLRHQSDRAAGCGSNGEAKDGGRPEQQHQCWYGDQQRFVVVSYHFVL